MKKLNEEDRQQKSGLFIGSDPLNDVRHRSAAKQDDDATDAADGDAGDDDATDGDETDSDLTDKGDTGDSDGKD